MLPCNHAPRDVALAALRATAKTSSAATAVECDRCTLLPPPPPPPPPLGGSATVANQRSAHTERPQEPAVQAVRDCGAPAGVGAVPAVKGVRERRVHVQEVLRRRPPLDCHVQVCACVLTVARLPRACRRSLSLASMRRLRPLRRSSSNERSLPVADLRWAGSDETGSLLLLAKQLWRGAQALVAFPFHPSRLASPRCAAAVCSVGCDAVGRRRRMGVRIVLRRPLDARAERGRWAGVAVGQAWPLDRL